MRVLLVTNDFPPKHGGIQRYLWSLYRALPERGIEVRVLAPAFEGDAAFDAEQPFDVRRFPGAVYWPTPALRSAIRDAAADCDVVTFGAMLPMNLLAPGVAPPVVVHTHGFEVAWTRVAGARAAFRRIAAAAELMTTVSDYCHDIIATAIDGRARVEKLVTGVDLERFTPDADGASIRARFNLGDHPVVTCVSRLVPRKGQDTIIEAMPAVLQRHPDAKALIVGGGPIADRLRKTAVERGVAGSVVFTGAVAENDLPAFHAAGDVFAMPCRSRFAKLEVEGLGLVYLEAQACARPAITGDSGGAPEAVRPGETGWVVPGGRADLLASVIGDGLDDRARLTAMGKAGRAWVERDFAWASVADRFAAMLRSVL